MKEWFENKKIAIIGNAESLFKTSYGVEIDSHDVVIRMNKAAMLYTHMDAERSHGTRTDFWIVWNAIEYRNKIKDIPKHIKIMHMSGRIRNNLAGLRIDFLYPMEMYDILKKQAGVRQNPTTGLMMLDYIDSCNPKLVSIYGFDWKDTPTFTDMNRKEEKTSGHNYDTEKEYCKTKFLSKPNYVLRK